MTTRARRVPVRHPRRQSRQQTRRRPSRLAGFLRAAAVNGRIPAFLLSVGLAVLAAGFLFSGDFTVRTVVVQGNSLAYADSIVASSGALGRHIFRLDTEEVARRVASHPAVASAEVSAEFPDRVVVQLHERVPALTWQTGDRAVLVDEHGWVIADGFDQALPRIVELQGEPPRVGGQIPPELIQAARFVRERLGQRLRLLEYDRSTGLTADLADGRTVVLGEPDRIPLKLSVLDAAYTLGDAWQTLDVREPERPYYR